MGAERKVVVDDLGVVVLAELALTRKRNPRRPPSDADDQLLLSC